MPLPRLLICNHGARGGSGSAVTLARNVTGHARFSDIAACCLNGAPGLEDVLGDGGKRPVYLIANLMSDGGVMTELRARGAAAAKEKGVELHIGGPLGLSQGIADVVSALAFHACAGHGWSPEDCHLLLVGHGSQNSRRPAEVAEGHARTIGGRNRFAGVSVGYLDEPPSVSAALSSLAKGPVIAVGLFADAGSHGAEDVPSLLAAADYGCEVRYAGPIGPTAPFADLLNTEIDKICRIAAL